MIVAGDLRRRLLRYGNLRESMFALSALLIVIDC